LSVVAVLVLAWPALASADESSGVSLGALLRGPAHAGDPALHELVQLEAELRAADASHVAEPALQRAHAAIGAARDSERRAEPKEVARRKQLAWAALSLADRLIARQRAEAALREAEARLAKSAADARAAQAARDYAKQALHTARGAAK
jgi:hypothetical protein